MPVLINICGASRSGTTMLDLMLGNAPNAFSCGEVYAWFRPFRGYHFNIMCSCPDAPCPYWERIKNFPESEFHKLVCKEFGVDFVIDSSKDNVWIVDSNIWARRHNIDIVNLLLWKSPLELAYSFWKRGLCLKDIRKGFVKYYGRFFQAGLPFVSVSFSELIANPAEKLRDICSVTGMEYFEGKEQFWERKFDIQHHTLYGSSGVRKMLYGGDVKGFKSSKNYPPEFLKIIDQVQREFVKDHDVQKIVERLKYEEVSSRDIKIARHKYEPPSVHPGWYYALKYYRRAKRYFPDSLPYK